MITEIMTIGKKMWVLCHLYKQLHQITPTLSILNNFKNQPWVNILTLPAPWRIMSMSPEDKSITVVGSGGQ